MRLSRLFNPFALIVVILTVMLTQFQNCAPTASTAASASSGSGQVRIVDEFNKADIQFVSLPVQVHDEAVQASVNGLCHRDHTGARVNWKLMTGEESSEVLLKGSGECRSGQFHVTVNQLEGVTCGERHLLIAEGDWGGSSATYLVKRCEPVMSEGLDMSGSMPAGTQCRLEYRPAVASAESSCSEVCFREDILVLEREQPADRCAGLAAQLAGL